MFYNIIPPAPDDGLPLPVHIYFAGHDDDTGMYEVVVECYDSEDRCFFECAYVSSMTAVKNLINDYSTQSAAGFVAECGIDVSLVQTTLET